MITVQECALQGPKILKPRVFGDSRGWVCETFSERHLTDAGIAFRCVQENQSFSSQTGTVRGLHFQKKPHAQAKLIRVMKGRIWDVAVDVRAGSPTYGQHVAVTLEENDGLQFYIPAGFAHGFCTLSNDALVLYKVDSLYAPEAEGGILWNDPDLGLDWPVNPAQAVLSDKDVRLPRLKDFSPLEW